MIGLDYLLAGYVQMASANIQCKPLKTPEISIVASDTTIKYDHSKTKEELNSFKIDTKSPYPANTQTHIGGLTSGEVSVSHQVQMMQEVFQGLGQACVYVNDIKIRVNINSTIYIASDYKNGSCMYQSVMEHEKKHIKVDRYIVNKYSRIIGQAMKEAVDALGPAQGPIPEAAIKGTQERMDMYLKGVLTEYSNKMSDERKKLQQQVDTLEEYQRVQGACFGRI